MNETSVSVTVYENYLKENRVEMKEQAQNDLGVDDQKEEGALCAELRGELCLDMLIDDSLMIGVMTDAGNMWFTIGADHYEDILRVIRRHVNKLNALFDLETD